MALSARHSSLLLASVRLFWSFWGSAVGLFAGDPACVRAGVRGIEDFCTDHLLCLRFFYLPICACSHSLSGRHRHRGGSWHRSGDLHHLLPSGTGRFHPSMRRHQRCSLLSLHSACSPRSFGPPCRRVDSSVVVAPLEQAVRLRSLVRPCIASREPHSLRTIRPRADWLFIVSVCVEPQNHASLRHLAHADS